MAKRLRDYELLQTYPVVIVHVMAVIGLVMAAMGNVPWEAWALCFTLYWVRMWGVTAGYHRYFSHRTFKTSRVFQFIIAIVAQSSAQRGVLWWAAHHRDHHKFSDQERDVHSPIQHGLVHAQIGWIYDHNGKTDYARVKDMCKFPELVVLNKVWVVPTILLAVLCTAWLGWAGLLIGFGLNTVLVWHGTFTINSLSHVWGNTRYETGDTSRNNWILAIITMGEGWHNNHHHFMNSARQGFFWWEFDMTYYTLKALSWVGIVWDIKAPPARVYGADLEAPASARDVKAESVSSIEAA
ncbi:MAG: acyl-CoA desaturase [Nannocystaceae bacterium]|nr:acyl-CoA desaturase [Nannocystaceae bacterium]